MDQTPLKPPPIGIEPRRFWLEKRLYAVWDAIYRYSKAGFDFPVEWMDEYENLVRELFPEDYEKPVDKPVNKEDT